jgi:hypothetical protein
MCSDDLEKRLARLLEKAVKEGDGEKLDLLLEEICLLLTKLQRPSPRPPNKSKISPAFNSLFS